MLFCVLLLCTKYRFAFSYNNEEPALPERIPEEAFPVSPSPQPASVFTRGLIATGQTLLSNLVVMSVSIGVYHLSDQAIFGWAQPNRYFLRANLNPRNWKWEDIDGFIVNHFGHPYQGASYFSAGRANAFSFYQSAVFSTIGSFTWELFCERQYASINDFIATIPTSMALGEMLFRLYAQAVNAGVPAPLAFFINPMAGFHRLVTRWEPPDYGTSIHNLRTHLGTNFAQTNASPAVAGPFSSQRFFVDAGFRVIYGDPFEQESRIPFNHFQMSLALGLDLGNHLDFRLISDGYLFSFSPVHTNVSRMSTGLSLHLDSITMGRFNWHRGSSINMFSNALNWTVKYQRLFSDLADMQLKFHAGPTFFGSSLFFCYDRYLEYLNNFGGGLNTKLFFNVNHRTLGSLETSVFVYTIWTYPGTSAITRGNVFWLFTDVTYLYHITPRMSLGISYSFALERGNFRNFPDTRKTNNTVRMFVAWNF